MNLGYITSAYFDFTTLSDVIVPLLLTNQVFFKHATSGSDPGLVFPRCRTKTWQSAEIKIYQHVVKCFLNIENLKNSLNFDLGIT